MSDELPDVADERDKPAYDELDLLRWAKRELPAGENAEETLQWMLREADGETLETIAEESNVPAPRVRKRVSRLREYFRERWSGQTAALVALGIVAALVALYALGRKKDDIAKDVPLVPSVREPLPHEVAEQKRREAFEKCDAGELRPCLDLLDEAKGLDPKGDLSEAVQRARKAAEEKLAPPPTPEPMPTSKMAPPTKGPVKGEPTAVPTTPIPAPPSSFGPSKVQKPSAPMGKKGTFPSDSFQSSDVKGATNGRSK
jgi:hypothetical protein